MIKRVVIAGCRYYNNYDEAKIYIDYCLSNIKKENDIIIVSGGEAAPMLLVKGMQRKTGLSLKNTLLIRKDLEKVQDQNEMNKWQ